ncbi:MAG: ribosome hibernation-promoting factor, HPF/YfiA family [Gammaproteobacteria bacterium]
MQINLHGHHVELTDPLKTYVNEKFAKLSRHFDHVTSTQVVLSVEKTRQKAEATIRFPGGEVFADCTDGDMYAAIDLLIDKLDRQILKHKEKIKSHK